MQVIRLRKAGHTYYEIAKQTGLSSTGVFNICKRHQELGAHGLRDAQGGRKAGQGRSLDVTQELLVRPLIADKTPDQLKMPYALWTRAAVGATDRAMFPHSSGGAHPGGVCVALGFPPPKANAKGLPTLSCGGKKWLKNNYPVFPPRAPSPEIKTPKKKKFFGLFSLVR
uniref:Transposase n=1 Tax=blood disease bacterium R229 TaxID=741978 RepID=G2ZUK3_9RALS